MLSSNSTTVRPVLRKEPLATALDEFRDGLDLQQKAQLLIIKGVPDANAVVILTTELDRKNAERRSRCIATRISPVLDSIQKYSTIVDTFSQSHADIAALVWGSVKLTLLVSETKHRLSSRVFTDAELDCEQLCDVL